MIVKNQNKQTTGSKKHRSKNSTPRFFRLFCTTVLGTQKELLRGGLIGPKSQISPLGLQVQSVLKGRSPRLDRSAGKSSSSSSWTRSSRVSTTAWLVSSLSERENSSLFKPFSLAPPQNTTCFSILEEWPRLVLCPQNFLFKSWTHPMPAGLKRSSFHQPRIRRKGSCFAGPFSETGAQTRHVYLFKSLPHGGSARFVCTSSAFCSCHPKQLPFRTHKTPHPPHSPPSRTSPAAHLADRSSAPGGARHWRLGVLGVRPIPHRDLASAGRPVGRAERRPAE